MSARFTLLPDPRFEPLAASLDQRVQDAAQLLDWQNFPSLLDPLMRGELDAAIRLAEADEGTIWLADRGAEALVPAYNTGPHADRFVGSFRQPFTEGLISMVLATQQLFSDNQVYRNDLQDRRLDELLEQVTCAMIAVPFHFARDCRGVISCVQLSPAAEASGRPGFGPDALRHIQRAGTVLGRLIDHHLLGVSVGWFAE